MTVAENVALVARYPRRLGLIAWGEARRRAAAALEAVGGGVEPDAEVGELPAAERSVVAIARALAVAADMLVLDEPTAALPEHDVALLLERLRRLCDRGLAILYVTHRLDEVFRVADRVTRPARRPPRARGLGVAETTPAALVRSIIGRAPDEVFRAPPRACRRPGPDIARLGHRRRWPGLASTLRSGEILGLVGLRGAGHHAVGRALFGDAPDLAGTVELQGSAYRPTSPAEAVAKGFGFVSSRRAEESLAPKLEPAREPASRTRPPVRDRPRLARHAAETALAARACRALRRAAARAGAGDRQPLGRQPAEGGAGPLAGWARSRC